jgi:endonuclease VIII-like 1
MPEISEVRISSDFINQYTKHKFFRIYKVEKENTPHLIDFSSEFTIISDSNGKELKLTLRNEKNEVLHIFIFMGMSGGWKYVNTLQWNSTKFVRMRLDDDTGNSLILYGGYMGPRFSVGKPFNGVKRGPDPTKKFNEFKLNIRNNLDKKDFNKPLGEILLNQKYFNGIGAYLTAEILGRLDINPFLSLNRLSQSELNDLFSMTLRCCEESYEFGGGELINWVNPIIKSRIDQWLIYYNNKDDCFREKFGKRNIWIKKKMEK